MAYPLILLVLLVPVGMFLLLKIIPQFGAIFAGFEVRLPAMTTGLLTISDLLVDHGWWLLACISGAIVAAAPLSWVPAGRVATRPLRCATPCTVAVVSSSPTAPTSS